MRSRHRKRGESGSLSNNSSKSRVGAMRARSGRLRPLARGTAAARSRLFRRSRSGATYNHSVLLHFATLRQRVGAGFVFGHHPKPGAAPTPRAARSAGPCPAGLWPLPLPLPLLSAAAPISLQQVSFPAKYSPAESASLPDVDAEPHALRDGGPWAVGSIARRRQGRAVIRQEVAC